jgi:RNA-directed DNA polymerase
MKQDGWYVRRSYAHFDLPLPFDAARAYVMDPERVRRHGFHPFLRFDIVRRRYKVRGGKPNVSTKSRPISIPAHLDGYVFAYYSKLLTIRYEAELVASGLGDCVLAYRSGRGSNIDFAKAAFDEIIAREECMAIALDLEGFFDSIDHVTLKRNWAKLLGAQRLPPDHFNVFRSITKHAEVNREACLQRLGIGTHDEVPRPICTPSIFRTVIRKNVSGLPNLVRTNTAPYGIPQGSQISALLSNLYMLDFDAEMLRLASDLGGYYRRYCDDILWLCRPTESNRIEHEIHNSLVKLGGTTKLNEAKTERSTFHRDANGRLRCDRPIQYLGFTFDGEHARVRSQTLSKFWRKLTYAARRAKRVAAQSTSAPGILYKRTLYRRFTHLGRRNLVSYAKRSEQLMETGAIRKQMRRHMPRITKYLKEDI